MTFRDLKPGSIVYLMHRPAEGGVVAVTGKVTAVSAPRFPQTKDALHAMQMVVDVTISENGEGRTYTTPDNLTTAYAGDGTVIATTREGIVNEVETIKAQCEEELAKVDSRRRTMEQCDRIIMEWNPELKEKRANEERLCKLESSMTDLKSMLSGLIKELKNEGT